MILNLSESWKEAYSEYLEEQEEELSYDIDETLEELTEAQIEAQEGFAMLKEYYQIFALTEGVKIKEGQSMDENGNVKTENTNGKAPTPTVRASMIKSILGTLENSELGEEDSDSVAGYQAASRYQIEDISDMKFPKNIIFFIGQLIKWVRNLVLYFIEKFKNLIRRLLGHEPRELNPEALKLQLQRVKKIEDISTVAKGFSVGKPVVPRILPAEKLEYILKEDLASSLGIVRAPEKDAIKKTPVIVTIDLSRDLQNIKALTDHFLKLFDHAYGSNNEHLFSTDDLEIILDTFKSTINNLKVGNVSQYSVSGGVAIDATGINPQRVKQNLVTTNQNVNSLKLAFTQTAEKIKHISTIVNHKEMLMMSDLGASYKLLTSETYIQLISVLEAIKPYIKKSLSLEKDMSKMQAKYNNLITELQGMQRSFSGVSNITFDTIHNRKIVELLNSASWMSDTVSLRLAGIGMYIKELKGVRDALVMITNLNAVPRGRGKIKDFLQGRKQKKLSKALYKYDKR